MRRFEGLDSLPRDLPRPVVTIGTFDGVHLGHQRVLGELVAWAHATDGTALAVTFTQPPRLTLGTERATLITSLPHRLLLLERMGVDACVVLAFTDDLARMPALTFMQEVLVGRLGVRGIVMGPGAAFGRDREGDETFVREHADALGLEVRSVPAAVVDDAPVSSTRIRAAVAGGDFDVAARLLGRPFSVFGTVVHGSGRGRALGFPTANLDLHHEITPPDGVYVAQAVLGEREIPALVSVGPRPTFAAGVEPESGESLVEIHLVDFTGALYGCDVEARFLTRLRGQRRFDDPGSLTAQIEQDLREARRFLSDLQPPEGEKPRKTLDS